MSNGDENSSSTSSHSRSIAAATSNDNSSSSIQTSERTPTSIDDDACSSQSLNRLNSASSAQADDKSSTEEDEDGLKSTLAADIFSGLVEDVIFGLILQTHRAAKLGYLQFVDPDSDSEHDKQFEIFDDSDVLGVFKNSNEGSQKGSSGYKNGQNSTSALVKYECVCPNCDRSLAAIRFAPHLEKCMGMGRNSSRIATRRIANGGLGSGAMTDYELDQLIESTGMIPNPRYFEQFAAKPAPQQPPQSSAPPHSSSESDLMSIINAVATATDSSTPSATIHASSSCSSLVEIEVSSSSSNCSINNINHPAHHHHHHHHHNPATVSSSSSFKLPVAKKKKLNNAKSAPQPAPSSSSSTSTTNPRVNIC